MHCFATRGPRGTPSAAVPMHNPYYAAAVDLQLHGPAGREAAERVLRRAWTCDEDGSWRALLAGLQAPRPAGLEPTVDATARFQLLVALPIRDARGRLVQDHSSLCDGLWKFFCGNAGGRDLWRRV